MDRGARPDQRNAIETISRGKAGGGIFETFGQLASRFLPLAVSDIDLGIQGTRAHIRIPGVM